MSFSKRLDNFLNYSFLFSLFSYQQCKQCVLLESESVRSAGAAKSPMASEVDFMGRARQIHLDGFLGEEPWWRLLLLRFS